MLNARSDRNTIGLLKKRPFKVMISFITLNGFLYRSIAAVTLVAFIMTTITTDFAWADRTPSELTSVGSDNRAVSPGVFKEVNVKTFNLPQYLGTIKDAWPSSNSQTRSPAHSQTIIHIQDAHCNYYAQHAVSDIIEYLNKEYGISEINLEGGAKDYDISIFTDIKEKAKREKVANYFVKEGLLNGAEYFAINNPEKVTLWGIEDVRLYIDNLKIYRNSLKYKDEVDKYLKNLSYILSNLKLKIYSKELLEFDSRYNAYKANNIDFKDYLGYLMQKSKDGLIDIKAYANICLFNQTLGQEAEIDFRKANNERDELIDRLGKRLSKNALEELVLKTVEFKSGRISQADFYRYLADKARSINIKPDDSPELKKYFVYVAAYQAIDKSKIMDEAQSLEDKLKASLFTTGKDRELDILSRNLAILKNIFNISLARDDYRYYKANERSFEMRNYTKFIERESPLYKIQAKLDDNIARLDDYREDTCKFYEYSFKRDAVFLKNISFSMDHRPSTIDRRRVSIVVTGGFHTENLCEQFKKQGIAYISIIPNFKTSDSYKCPYFNVLSGSDKTQLVNAVPAMLAANLAPVSLVNPALHNAVVEEFGVTPVPAASHTVEAVSAEGSIGVGELKGKVDAAKPAPAAPGRAGAWFAGDTYRKIASFIETGVSYGFGAALYGILAATGLGGFAAILAGAIIAGVIFTTGHFRIGRNNDGKLIVSFVKHAGKAEVAILAPLTAIAAGLSYSGNLWLAIPATLILMILHHYINVRAPPAIITRAPFATTEPLREPATATPAETVRKSPHAYALATYDGFRGVDLEHFVFAQTKLAERNLPPQVLSRLLSQLQLSPNLTGDAVYQRILERLAEIGYSKEVVDIINGETYQDPRLIIEIIGQNKNPRLQSIFEAIANSLDAHGYGIGQFGKGVKQVIDWLAANGKDRVDVFTCKINGKAYQLTIIKDEQGQYYIQIRNISDMQFQDIAQNASGQSMDHGTILQVSIASVIPRTEKDNAENQANSQSAIVEGIHKRFPFVTAVDIFTQVEGQQVPQKVNGFETKVVVVPPGEGSLSHADTHGKFVKVLVRDNSLTVVDNGSAMDAAIIARMFVPREGTKHPEPLSGQAAEAAKKNIKVVYDPNLPHRVSFSRNGEVIAALDMPEEIYPQATLEGGLSIELGGLMDVPESRDNIQIPLSFKAGEPSNFQMGIEYAISQILANPRLSNVEKLKFINTIVVGLDSLIRGNANFEQTIKAIRGDMQKALAPIIAEIRKEGVIILPHYKQFAKLAIPQGKQVIFLHEKLFDWHGASGLKELGAQVVPGVILGDKPLVVAAFTPQATKEIQRFSRNWHLLRQDERLPVIKTDRFVAISRELGQRVIELTEKRKKGLSPKEEKELTSLLERVNIITGEEVITSYEVSAVTTKISLAPLAQAEPGKVDTDAINRFLTRPPILQAPVSTKADNFSDAYDTVKNITDPVARVKARAVIAVAKAKAGLTKEAASAFSSLIAIAEGMDNVVDKAMCLSEIALALIDAGFIDEAKNVHSKLVELEGTSNKLSTVVMYSRMATIQARLGDSNFAYINLMKAYALLSGGEHYKYQEIARAISAVVEAMMKDGKITEAKGMAASNNPFCNALVFNVLAQYEMLNENDKEKLGELPLPENIIGSAKLDDLTKIIALIEIAKAYAKRSQIDKTLPSSAANTFGLVIKITREFSETDRSIFFPLIAEAQASAGFIDSAIATMSRINDGCSRAYAQGAIAKAQIKKGLFKEAENYITKAIENSSNHLMASSKTEALVAIVIAQAELAAAKAKQREGVPSLSLQDAITTAEKITEKRQRACALAAIAIAQEKAGLKNEASNTLADAARIAFSENDYVALIAVADAEAKLGGTNGATGTFARAVEVIENKEYENPVDMISDLCKVAVAQAGVGVENWGVILNKAEAKAKSLPLTQRDYAFSKIAMAYAEVGFSDAGRRVADKISRDAEKAHTFAEIAKFEIRDGKIENSKKLISLAIEIADRYSVSDLGKFNALISIAEAQIAAGLIDEAKKTLGQASNIANNNLGNLEKGTGFCRIAANQAQIGALVSAKQNIAVSYGALSGLPETWQKKCLFQAVIDAYIKSGLIAEAIRSTNDVLESSLKQPALTKIAIAQANAGSIQEALETLKQIDGIEDKSNVLMAIAKAQTELATRKLIQPEIVRPLSLQDAITTAEKITEKRQRACALAAITIAQDKAGLRNEALSTLADAATIAFSENDYVALIAVAEAQAKLRLIDIGRGTFARAAEITEKKQHRRMLDNISDLCEIAVAMAKEGWIEDCDKIFAKAADIANSAPEEQKASALSRIAIAYAEIENDQAARLTAGNISHDLTKAYTLAMIAKSQIKSGEVEMAKDTISDALLAVRNYTDVDLSHVNALIPIAEAQIEAGLTQNAIEALDKADGIAIQLDDYERATAFSRIAANWAKLGLTQKANEKLTTAYAIYSRLTKDWQQKIVSFAIVEALIKSNLITDPVLFSKVMSDPLIESQVYPELAKTQAEAGLIQDALETAKKVTDSFPKSEALLAIAKAQAQAAVVQLPKQQPILPEEKIEKLKELLAKAGMLSDVKARCQGSLEVALAFIKVGNLEGAKVVIDAVAQEVNKVSNTDDKINILAKISAAYLKAGDTLQAEDYFAAAVSMANKQSGNWKISALTNIAVAQAGGGPGAAFIARTTFEEAITLIKKLPDAEDRAMAFTQIAIAQAKVGFVKEAKEAILEAEATLSEMSPIHDEDKINFTVANINWSEVEAGLTDNADAAIVRAKDRASKIIDNAQKIITLIDIAIAEAKAGMKGASITFSQALELARKMPDGDEKSNQLALIAMAEAEAGLIANAIELAKEIPGDQRKSYMLSVIDLTQIRAELAQVAKESAVKQPAVPKGNVTTNKAQLFEGILVRSSGEAPNASMCHIFAEVAMAQAETGLIQDARGTIARIMAMFDVVPDDYYEKSHILAKIAKAQVKAGLNEEGVQTFNRAVAMADQLSGMQRSFALCNIAIAQAEAGFIDSARSILLDADDIANKCVDEEDSISALAEVAAAFAKAGLLSDAQSALLVAVDQLQHMKVDTKNEIEKAGLIAKIARAKISAGAIEDAYSMIMQALDMAKKSFDSVEKVVVLCEIAQALEEITDFRYPTVQEIGIEEREDTLQLALETIDKIKDSKARLTAIGVVAFTNAKIGKIDRTKEMLEQITEAADLADLTEANSAISLAAAMQEISRIKALKEEVTEAGQKTDQEKLERWNRDILSQRNNLIQQAQASYQPILDCILSNVPEEFQQEILTLFKKAIELLYKKQESAIVEKFQASLAGKPLELHDNSLPFDLFDQRAKLIMQALPEFLKLLTSQLSQENHALQASIYRTFFSNLLELGRDYDGKIENLNNDFLMTLALGWKAHSGEQIKAAGEIIELISRLRHASGGILHLETTQKIIGLLASFSDKDAAKNIPVIIKQLSKIFNLKPAARDKFLSDMDTAFSTIETEQLDKYLENPQAPIALGKARPFAIFLTHEVEQVVSKTREMPKGEDVKLPNGGIALSQIIKLEQQRPKEGAEDIMDMDYLLQNLENLPEPSSRMEEVVRRNVTVQRESGAYTAEIAQNSRDATRKIDGELVVDFYLQKEGTEYVEEATDNGTGALKEIALIIDRSTKAAGEQLDETGFFGTGKYTIFEGVDRLEIITKNKDRAFMFSYKVNKDDSGNPLAIRLAGIRKVNDPKLVQGVTVRRIKNIENTIPELDHLLAQRAWRSFAGLSHDAHFTIYMVNHEGQKEPLVVKQEQLGEVEFKVTLPGQGERNFGALRIISAEDMPLQVVDRAGLRVSEINPKYLDLVPGSLQKFVKKLGIIIQIPLPLIRGRSAFEHEDLKLIQKYVAIAFYRAIAYKAMTQTSPQFTFADFPFDWETNDSYWKSIDPRQDKQIIDMATMINTDREGNVSQDELENLLVPKGTMDKEQRVIRLILMLEVVTDVNQSNAKTSLLGRRLAVQARINEQRARAQRELLERGGLSKVNIPQEKDVPYFEGKLSQAALIEQGHDQMSHVEDFIVDPKEYTTEEQELVALGHLIGRNFGIEQIILLNDEVFFVGCFKIFKGKHTMFLKRNLAQRIGESAPGMIDKGTNAVVHELAHLLEEFSREDDMKKLWQEGYVSHASNFTHDATEGFFSEAMRLVATVSLANHGSEVAAVSAVPPEIGIAHMEGLPLRQGGPIVCKGIAVNNSNIGAVKSKVKEDAVSLGDIEGKTVYVDNELISRSASFGFGTKEGFIDFLRKYLTERFKTSPPVEKEIIIALLESSSNLCEDHKQNGFIGINPQLFNEKIPSELRAKLLKLGLNHELKHEAGRNDEAALLKEDVVGAKELGITAEELRGIAIFAEDAELIRLLESATPALRPVLRSPKGEGGSPSEFPGKGAVGPSTAASAAAADAEPHLAGNDAYGAVLRSILKDPAVTKESAKRVDVLRRIGRDLEIFVRDYIKNNDIAPKIEDIHIVLVPCGSSLKGYAGNNSDIDFEVYFISATPRGKLVNPFHYMKDREAFFNKCGKLFRREKKKDNSSSVYTTDAIAPGMMGRYNLSYFTEDADADIDGDFILFRLALGWNQFDLENLCFLFLPAAYGNGELIEKARNKAIRFISAQDNAKKIWKSIQAKFIDMLEIEAGLTKEKKHLAKWLKEKDVGRRELNKQHAKTLALPSLDEMRAIYGVTDEAVSKMKEKLSIAEEATEAEPSAAAAKPAAIVPVDVALAVRSLFHSPRTDVEALIEYSPKTFLDALRSQLKTRGKSDDTVDNLYAFIITISMQLTHLHNEVKTTTDEEIQANAPDWLARLKDIKGRFVEFRKQLIESRRAPAAIINNIDRAIEILDNRILFAEGRLEGKVLSVRNLVENACRPHAGLTNEPYYGNVTITGLENTLKVKADEIMLLSALANIVSNANEFADKGKKAGVKPAVEVSIAEESGFALIKVRNNGPAIPEELLGRLFEYGVSGREEEGHGIGATEALRVVTRHGGSIRALGPEGKWNVTFEIRLPLYSEGGTAAPSVSTENITKPILGAFKARASEAELPNQLGRVKIECLSEGKGYANWDSLQAQVAVGQLIAASRAVVALHESKLLGSAANAAKNELKETKKNIDRTASGPLRQFLSNSTIKTLVIAGEGSKPKAADEGEVQPGLYAGEQYGKEGNIPVDVAYDPVDGTTSAAKGAELIPEAPTVLAATYGARNPINEQNCFAVMGPNLADIPHSTDMWDGVTFHKDIIEQYLKAVAKAKGKKLNQLRVVTHGELNNEVVFKILKELGVQIIMPASMLEQLYVVPMALSWPDSMDVMLCNGLGTVEIAMCCITLCALDRGITIDFTIDGKKKFGIDDIVNKDVPAFQTIAAVRDAPGLMIEKGQALFVANNGAVYRVSISWTDDAGEKIRSGDAFKNEIEPVPSAAGNNIAPAAASLASAENPVYMAFCMLIDSGVPDVDERDPDKIKALAATYGISEENVTKALGVFDRLGVGGILKEAPETIKNALADQRAGEAGFYFEYILLPFMGFEAKGLNSIDSGTREAVLAQFDRTFNAQGELRNFVNDLRKHLDDKKQTPELAHRLNDLLKRHGFNIDAIPDYRIGYRITKTVPVNSGGVGDILFVSRIGPSMLTNERGKAYSGSADVMVYEDTIENELNEIGRLVAEGEARRGAGETKGEERGSLRWVSDMIRALYADVSKSLSRDEMKRALTLDLVLHEMKHRWDVTRPGMSELVLDREISAHLTEAILGNLPRVGLVSLLTYLAAAWIANNKIPEVNEALKAVMGQVAEITDETIIKNLSDETIREKLKAIYDNYSCIQGGAHLPSIDEFNEKVALPAARLVATPGAEKTMSSLEEFDKLVNPENKPDNELTENSSIRKLRKGLEGLVADDQKTKDILETVRYIIKMCSSAKALLRDTGVPDNPVYLFMPSLSDKLCNMAPGALQSRAQAIWKIFRDNLNNEFRINNLTITFYNGTLGDLREKMSRNPDLKTDNTVIFIDGNTNRKTDDYREDITGKYYNIQDVTEGNLSGYLSVGGHIALGLGILRLHTNKDPAYYTLVVKALIALSYNPESLNKYEVQTATTANVDQFLLDARDGRIKIVLPPIQKENIDGQMRDYIASEEAAMKSL